MSQFIDKCKMFVVAGHGGPGCISFRREKFIPKGGPDGGDGGKGGDIIFQTKIALSSLSHLYHLKEVKAQNGLHGSGQNRSGEGGVDTVLNVPVGTVIKDSAGVVIKELNNNNEQFTLLRGGKGGKGNSFFRNSVNQAPRYFQKGLPGQEANIILEMKLIADLGLVGFPNAGKSTFLSKVTNATPKIANYPFTTLTAQLGVFNFDDESSMVIADIPGLIEGASEGIGLGFQFLKHIEKTKHLLFLIDISEEGPYQKFLTLQDEMRTYNKSIVEKPFHIALNKTDLVDEDQIASQIKTFPKELRKKILSFSCHTEEDITIIRKLLGSIIRSNINPNQEEWDFDDL